MIYESIFFFSSIFNDNLDISIVPSFEIELTIIKFSSKLKIA